MSLKLTILVGTMTGTAELVAEEIQDALRSDGIEAEVRFMDGLDAAVFVSTGPFLIVTSTYGQGDVPDNAKGLFDSLSGERPDLGAVAYGIVALGDRTYTATYCRGGKRFDELLASLGAGRVGDMLLHDASSGAVPEEVAVEWVKSWVAHFRSSDTTV